MKLCDVPWKRHNHVWDIYQITDEPNIHHAVVLYWGRGMPFTRDEYYLFDGRVRDGVSGRVADALEAQCWLNLKLMELTDEGS